MGVLFMFGFPDSQVKLYHIRLGNGYIVHLDLAGVELPPEAVQKLRRSLYRRMRRYAKRGQLHLAWYGIGSQILSAPAATEEEAERLKALAEWAVRTARAGAQAN